MTSLATLSKIGQNFIQFSGHTVPGKPFQPGRIVIKHFAGVCIFSGVPLMNRLLALPRNIILGRKSLQGTIALAYCQNYDCIEFYDSVPWSNV